MLKKFKSVYIIGIGGISLSAIAEILLSRGLQVYGSDETSSNLTENLEKKGVIFKNCDAPEFVEKADAIIYTSAISSDNRDILLAKKLCKPIFSRAQILGELSKEKKCISVAGTHGKTTTTGMIASILLNSGVDPTIHIGGILNNINSNLHIGQGEYFVTEACEYKDSFLTLSNYVGVILNVHEDHLDYFKNINNIYNSFNKFIENTDENGVIIYNFDDFNENLKLIRPNISFGLNKGSKIRGINIKEYSAGRYMFDLQIENKIICTIYLPCFGKHNVYNALSSIATCLFLGIDIIDIKRGIENFKGVKRRMELIKEGKNHLIIHDYAHHPQEIEATLKACKDIKKKGKIIAIFQPHTYSRTRDLFNEFLNCFYDCDEVWLLPIYPAREKAIKGITSFALNKALKNKGIKTRYFKDFEKCKNEIIKEFDNVDIFAILGAGNIENLANSLKKC